MTTRLTAGMVYLETSDGDTRGRSEHRPLALQLVTVARLSGGFARVQAGDRTASAQVSGDRWAVVVHGPGATHAASLAREKLGSLIRL